MSTFATIVPRPRLSEAQRAALEKIYERAETLFCTWACQLVSVPKPVLTRRRLAESTTDRALNHLRYLMGLRSVDEGVSFSNDILLKLRDCFYNACREAEVAGNLPFPDPLWHQALLRQETHPLD